MKQISALDYKRKRNGQRYQDRLSREQRRMPLFSSPLMPLSAAHKILAKAREASRVINIPLPPTE